MAVGIGFGLENIFGMGQYFFSRHVSNKTWLRALYGEINLNMDIIGTLDLDYFKGKEINDRVFRKVAGSLQTSVAEAILFDDKINRQSTIISLLQEKGILSGLERFIGIKDGAEVDIPGNAPGEQVVTALYFAVSRIRLLKSLSALPDEEDFFAGNFRLALRLTNIVSRYKMIRAKLVLLPAVQDLRN